MIKNLQHYIKIIRVLNKVTFRAEYNVRFGQEKIKYLLNSEINNVI